MEIYDISSKEYQGRPRQNTITFGNESQLFYSWWGDSVKERVYLKDPQKVGRGGRLARLKFQHFIRIFLGSLSTKNNVIFFRVHVVQRHYIFKPATLQSLWTAIQVTVITVQCSSDHLWWNNEHDHRRMIIITAVFKIMSIAIIIITATIDEYSFLRRSTRSAQNWNQRETPYWFGRLKPEIWYVLWRMTKILQNKFCRWKTRTGWRTMKLT